MEDLVDASQGGERSVVRRSEWFGQVVPPVKPTKSGSAGKGSPLGQISTMTTSSHGSITPRPSIVAVAGVASRHAPATAMDLTGATASGGMAVAHRHHMED